MKIDTRDTTINDLLKHFYFIPRFQRPYSWEKEQVEQFWNDSVNENPADYFIGSVVLYKAGEKYGVVDGQQRITTVVLMLAALRNAFKAAQLTEQASGIQAIIEKKDIDNQRQYILATESSYPYLQDKILSAGEPEVADELSKEEELLASMFGYIGERVEEALDNWPHPAPDPQIPKHEAILKKIRDSVLSIKLITVELDNEDDAYLIFETLNTRGC